MVRMLTMFVSGFAISVVNATDFNCNDFGHFDIEVAVEQQKIVLDTAQKFPRDWLGNVIVLADLGDFAGGPHKTDDPGWVMPQGNFKSYEFLWFRALQPLQFWNTHEQQWQSRVPNGERVRYFGAVPSEVFQRNDADELAFYQQGTIFTVNETRGPVESTIERAAVDGTIHTHLDFCLEDATGDCMESGLPASPPYPTGDPARGLYAIKLQLFSDADNFRAYRASAPITILMNHGLSNEQCTVAIESLQQIPLSQPLDDIPAAGILLLN